MIRNPESVRAFGPHEGRSVKFYYIPVFKHVVTKKALIEEIRKWNNKQEIIKHYSSLKREKLIDILHDIKESMGNYSLSLLESMCIDWYYKNKTALDKRYTKSEPSQPTTSTSTSKGKAKKR
jgi:hypothetical protein